ncbi:hypothetical protein OBBRIDRAFT_808226 [Obba rivulosa]|uniref:DUF302 domain-containing protein n=1 Tax=Obba rivulosa TaxID=1052685 RepID=A0A8E2DF63_9APHY|nr:hypothetical protein OBBRIDRAFT_808226 [Obba rivulosa]
MSKQTFQFPATRVVFETPTPAATVCARLDEELHRGDDSQAALKAALSAQNKEELEKNIQALSHGNDFLFFGAIPHHTWFNAYMGTTDAAPLTITYTLGNPLIAQTMLRHSLVAGLHVPPRVLVLERADGNGTRIVYDLPSSIIAPGLAGGPHEELREAAEALDAKLERLIAKVTRE